MASSILDLDSLKLDDVEDVDSAIATYARLYETIGRKLSQLRTHRNNTISIISRIPNEILAEIITLSRITFRHHAESKPFQWLWITHVCSRWRSIALDLPELWNIIPTGQFRDCTEAYVARSTDLPLSIVPGRADFEEDLDPRFVVPLLPVIDRLRDLKLYVTRNTMMGLDDRYIPSIGEHAPALETLSLRYTSLGDDAEPPDYFWFLTFASMPRLRELEVYHLPFHIIAGLVQPSLTRLKLTALSPFDVDKVLEVLGKLPLLRDLEVSDLDTVQFQSPIPASSLHPLVHLDCLYLVSSSDMASTRLLNHLLIPSACTLGLRELSSRVDGCHFIYSVIASKKNGAGCVGSPQALFSMHIDKYAIQFWDDAEDGPLLSPQQLCCEWLIRKPVVDLSLRSSSPTVYDEVSEQTLPLRDLRRLCLEAIKIPRDFFDKFANCLYLTELHCHGNKHMRRVLEQLGCRSSTEQDHQSSDIPLPLLRTLKLDSPRWHSHPGVCSRPFEGDLFSEAVDTLLAAREQMGAPLEELHIGCVRFLDEENDMPWFERMSAGPLRFTWTRCHPSMDRCGLVKCDICCKGEWGAGIGSDYEGMYV